MPAIATEDLGAEASSGSEDEMPPDVRRAILEPAITSVVAALGGFEGGVYKLGDEAHGCLRDLKKYWRKDDTDDDRTVARIFWKTRVLPNDLVPILLITAGEGFTEDKRAIVCADLITAMTWPVDIAEELKELDDNLDQHADFTELIISHLHYKVALLRPGVMQALLAIVLPCITKDKKTRQRRDTQIISVVLHLIRNLAFIKDLPPNTHASSDRAELSSLQSKLIATLSETHFLDFLLTIASNAASDALFNEWNTIVLEIFYLLYRGVKPSALVISQSTQSKETLSRLLAVEDTRRREQARKTTSRHSRFGTTISVTLNSRKQATPPTNEEGDAGKDDEDGDGPERVNTNRPAQPLVFHRQQAIRGTSGAMIDLKKKKTRGKEIRIDELGRMDNLSVESRTTLRGAARTFLENCFNPFISSLLKDIKAERPKITEKDNLRLIYIGKWFLEFFLLTKAEEDKDKQRGNGKDTSTSTSNWGFELVAEIVERGWIIWVMKRMREAVDDKPKQWVELQAGVECLTQLLLLIDVLLSPSTSTSTSSSPLISSELQEAAELLQHQLVYNGEILDIAYESLRSYKPGTQSLAYLNSSVHLGYLLLRLLERWSKAKGGEVYVRKRKARKARKRGANGLQPEEEGVPDVEDPEDYGGEEDQMIQETMFTFETFEARFANAEITNTLLVYLSRYREFESPDYMKRVVSLLHRQAIRAKAEGLFFKVSALNLFQTILVDQKSLPKDQPYRDLISLINFVLRKFFKAVAEDSFLIVEAFFPKNNKQWRAFSSWEPEEKATVEDTRFPQDVQVKKGYTWSQQLGIAIATLIEDGQLELIDWTKEILATVIGQKQRVIEETDGDDAPPLVEAPDPDDEEAEPQTGPSNEAIGKFTDYLIPYLSDEHGDAATRNPRLKLVFRLVSFHILDENADELEWFVPAAIMPSELQRSYNIINQFLDTPLDLGGKKASQMLSKKARRRRRRAPSPMSDNDDDDALFGSGEGNGGDKEESARRRVRREKAIGDKEQRRAEKRKARKAKEQEKYKSAQFIEDSDEDPDEDVRFFEREKALREKMDLAAAEGKFAAMHATGTKRRRNKNPEGGGKRKKRKSDAPPTQEGPGAELDVADLRPGGATGGDDSDDAAPAAEKQPPRPKPRPKARFGAQMTKNPLDEDSEDDVGRVVSPNTRPSRMATTSDDEEEEEVRVAPRRKSRIVISDDEDD